MRAKVLAADVVKPIQKPVFVKLYPLSKHDVSHQRRQSCFLLLVDTCKYKQSNPLQRYNTRLKPSIQNNTTLLASFTTATDTPLLSSVVLGSNCQILCLVPGDVRNETECPLLPALFYVLFGQKSVSEDGTLRLAFTIETPAAESEVSQKRLQIISSFSTYPLVLQQEGYSGDRHYEKSLAQREKCWNYRT